jgi:hypothetical protein
MATKKQGARGHGGPPVKPARKGQKYQIGVIVAGPTKKDIVESTKVSGRSISREVEHLVERALAYDRVLEAMRVGGGRGGLETLLRNELRKAGYVPVRDPATGKFAWHEPGHPAIAGHSAFEEIKPDEWEAHAAAMTVSEEEIQRRNAEAIRRSNLGPAFDTDAAIKRIEEVEELSKAPAKKDDAA